MAGEKSHKEFHKLETKFGKVDDVFCQSRNMKAGTDIDEADIFYGHVQQVLEEDTAAINTHYSLLFGLLIHVLLSLCQEPNQYLTNLIFLHLKNNSDMITVKQVAYDAKSHRKRKIIRKIMGNRG
jgi:hypothetical protein